MHRQNNKILFCSLSVFKSETYRKTILVQFPAIHLLFFSYSVTVSIIDASGRWGERNKRRGESSALHNRGWASPLASQSAPNTRSLNFQLPELKSASFIAESVLFRRINWIGRGWILGCLISSDRWLVRSCLGFDVFAVCKHCIRVGRNFFGEELSMLPLRFFAVLTGRLV